MDTWSWTHKLTTEESVFQKLSSCGESSFTWSIHSLMHCSLRRLGSLRFLTVNYFVFQSLLGRSETIFDFNVIVTCRTGSCAHFSGFEVWVSRDDLSNQLIFFVDGVRTHWPSCVCKGDTLPDGPISVHRGDISSLSLASRPQALDHVPLWWLKLFAPAKLCCLEWSLSSAALTVNRVATRYGAAIVVTGLHRLFTMVLHLSICNGLQLILLSEELAVRVTYRLMLLVVHLPVTFCNVNPEHQSQSQLVKSVPGSTTQL